MIKRITSIIFVLLVNIALLSSIVIPHHHHENEVCIVNTHCNSDHESHENDIATHGHEADNSGHCAFTQEFIISKDYGNHHIIKLKLFVKNIPYKLVETELENNLKAKSQFVASHPPEIVQLYNSFIIQSKGLRAPPVV